jgi:hypothetical protein
MKSLSILTITFAWMLCTATTFAQNETDSDRTRSREESGAADQDRADGDRGQRAGDRGQRGGERGQRDGN